MAVHRDDALDHAVEDRGDLRALLARGPGSSRAAAPPTAVERAAEGADLVGASATGARLRKLPSLIRRAMACISTTGRVTRPGDEQADAERGHAARRRRPASSTRWSARSAVTSGGGSASRSTRPRCPASRPATRRRGAACRRVRAPSQIATVALRAPAGPPGGPVVLERARSSARRSDSPTTRPSPAIRVTRAPVGRASADEGLDRRRGAAAAQRPRASSRTPATRGQAPLERLDGERLERAVQNRARRYDRDAHEARPGSG